MALGLILSGISAIAGMSSANKAAKAQAASAAEQKELGVQQLEESRRQYDTTNALNMQVRDDNIGIAGGVRDAQMGYAADTRDANIGIAGQVRDDQLGYLNPFGGSAANDALRYNYGIGDQPDGYTGFEGTPGFNFAMAQGQRSIDGSAAASGNLFSGATLKAQQEYGTGLAQQDYNNYLNGLSNMASSERQVAGAQSGVVGTYGGAVTNANTNYGNQMMAAQGGYAASATGANNNYAGMAANAGNAYASASQNALNFQGNAIANQGDAAATGATAVNNQFQNGLNNAYGVWNYQNRVAN